MPRLTPEDVDQLPTGPGVYLFHDVTGTVVYVGKAVNLRARVRQYVHLQDERPTVRFLMARATQVETMTVDNEVEAILLENTLIKKHRPRYNIQLRDDKDYVSLRINVSHEWPMISVVRRPPPDPKSLTFGPFASAGAVRETLRFLRRTFPLRTCRDTVLYNRARPCLEYQIGRCVAPCVEGHTDQDEYRKLVHEVELFLRGKNAELEDELKAEMKAASAAHDFEKAAKLRDRLKSVQRVLSEQKVASHDDIDRDVFGFFREGDRGALVALTVRGGRLVSSRPFVFDETAAEDAEVITSFLAQFYGEREVPPEVLLPRESPDLEALAKVLETTRGARVDVRTPQRGGKKDLVEMASSNAEMAFRRAHDEQASVRRDLEGLARALELDAPPVRIECVDMSMIQGSAPVGAIVAFVDGKPAKNLYRRFHVKDLAKIHAQGQEISDFAMMKEVLERRFRRSKQPDAGTWSPPDLLVIDGGKGQLAIAEAVLSDLGIVDLPLAALAKDPVHGKAKGPSEERVFVPGRANPVSFQREKGGMFLLQRIRDEAHRFAIDFHRKERSKSTLRSALDDIAGIGETRRKSLLRHFGSAKRVSEATLEELEKAPTMGRKAALAVHTFFHPETPPAECPSSSKS